MASEFSSDTQISYSCFAVPENWQILIYSVLLEPGTWNLEPAGLSIKLKKVFARLQKFSEPREPKIYENMGYFDKFIGCRNVFKETLAQGKCVLGRGLKMSLAPLSGP